MKSIMGAVMALLMMVGATNQIDAGGENSTLRRRVSAAKFFNADNQPKAIHDAVKKGNADAVQKLLADGADVNAKSWYGTPLLIAVSNRDKEMVKLLLEVPGIDVNTKNESGMTVLMLAVLWGDGDIVEKLLQIDELDLWAANSMGQTASGIAKTLYDIKGQNYYEIARLIDAKQFGKITRAGASSAAS